MKTPVKILIVLLVASAAMAAVILKKNKTPATTDTNASAIATATGQTPSNPIVAAKLPKLVDLGAGKCVPCKMMKPILDKLKRDYASRFITEFIDVWENPAEGKKHGIEMIPTQIFYDAEGKELFRHTGFFGKEDILAKWKELGVNLNAIPSPSTLMTNQVGAFYFHGTVRCETCRKIESLAKEEIQRRFASELANQRLVFASVNYDEPENRHFQQTYKLPCPSLVIVRRAKTTGDEWKLLGETWQLVDDTKKFNFYVGTEVAKFLKPE